ncbi:hypothetical protein F4781DRAFT_413699 [Annulohypoxylon bovei var. microspora]|nr:hypothetical protein F4781DRAFT_413699 [Annulohypoxylon bovei var. microspora]
MATETPRPTETHQPLHLPLLISHATQNIPTTMAAPTLDLELPPFNPELTSPLRQADCTGASFAIYSMVDSMSTKRLTEIATIPQEEWESYDMDTPLIKPGVPSANFGGRALRDVVAAHIAMDKELAPREGGASAAGWWPHVFVVVTSEDIEDHGLLLVYGVGPLSDPDEPRDGGEEVEEPTMGKFFFKSRSLCDILSGIALSGDDLDYLHETHDMDREKFDDSDEEEDEDVE